MQDVLGEEERDQRSGIRRKREMFHVEHSVMACEGCRFDGDEATGLPRADQPNWGADTPDEGETGIQAMSKVFHVVHSVVVSRGRNTLGQRQRRGNNGYLPSGRRQPSQDTADGNEAGIGPRCSICSTWNTLMRRNIGPRQGAVEKARVVSTAGPQFAKECSTWNNLAFVPGSRQRRKSASVSRL